MYKNYKRYDKNGYVIVNIPNHPKAFDATGDKNPNSYCVYEHVLVAEELIDRPLKEGEVVHHLDENRSNNSPDNLLVLSNPMHTKLHSWLDKNNIEPKENYEQQKQLGCVRCAICDKPIAYNLKYCSHTCSDLDTGRTHRYEHPDKVTLEKLVWSKPTQEVAKDFGVSDTAIQKLCVKLNIQKPPRGYWNKVNAGLICILP